MTAPSPRRSIADSTDAHVPAVRALGVAFPRLAVTVVELATAARRSADRVLDAGADSDGFRTPILATVVLCVAVVGHVPFGAAVESALPSFGAGSPLLLTAGMAVRGDPSDDLEDLAETIERLEAGERNVDVSTDRDDTVGRLYEAVDGLASALRDRERERERSERFRRELYRITSDAELDREEKIRRMLELGCERLGVENGLVTRIDEETDRYEVETAVGSDFVEAGTVAGLSETFCRNTVRSDDILGIYDAVETDWREDPGHRKWEVGCYVGGKITVEDELYGTLCFVDRDPRGEPFTHEEKAFVDLMARWTSYEFERRRRQRDLRIKDRAMDRAPVGVTLTDPSLDDNPLVYANEEFRRLTGYSDDEAIGRNCRFLQGEATAPEPVAAMREAIDANESVSVELRNYRRDGERFWNRVSVAPVEDERGEVAHFVGFQEDVTDRKERERELRETNERLGAIIEASPAAILAFDPEGRVELWNPAAEDIFGWSEEEVLGDPLPIVPEERADEFERLRDRLLDGESVAGVETRRRRKDGSLIDVSLSAAPMRDDDGDVIGIMGALEDVTERKRLESELREVLGRVTDAFYALDDDWTFEFVNERARELMGAGETDLVGESIWEAFPKREDTTMGREFRRAMDEQTPVSFEEYSERLDSWFDIRAYPSETGLSVYFRDVTDRKRREEELERQTSLIDSVFEQLPIYLYVKDEEGRHVRTSPPSFSDEYPDDEEWFRGKTDLDILPEELASETYADDMRVIEEGESVIERVEYNPEEEIWLLTSKVPWRDGDGEIRGLIGVTQPITEQKERERELRETNERLNAIVEASPAALIASDFEGNVDLWNPAAERIFGWSEEEVLGTRLPIVPDDRIEEFEELRERLADGETVTGAETKRRRKDGSLIDVSISAAPMRDSDGTMVGVIAALQDVTERKERERELRETKRRLERYKRYTDDVLDAVDDVFYVLDEDGYNQRWNASLSDVTGYSDEEIRRTNAVEFFPEEHRDRVAAAIEEVFETGDARVEAPFRTGDDGFAPYEFVASALEDPDGNPVVAGVGRDVTERVEYERELERTRHLLEQSERLARVGAWEIRADGDEPVALTATDETYRIYGIPPDADLPLEKAFEHYHPDDEERIREGVERAIRDGEGYDYEARLITAGGDERWVRSIADPVRDDGEIVAVRGSIQDVTDRKEREVALESLHDAAQDLLTTETEADAAEIVVETAAEILDVDGIGIYLLDAETNRLEPTAGSESFVDGGEMPPPITAGDSDSLLWDCYVTGTPTVFDETEAADRAEQFDADVAGGLLVPIGDHGVFVVATSNPSVDEELRRLVETLVATAEAALDRIESEASLRQRDAELEARNSLLKRQIKVNEIIRTIGQSLVGATSQDEIERTVCDRLVGADDIAFAWIGDFGPGGDELVPRAWAGSDPEYLDAVSLDAAGGTREPSVTTARTEDPTVVPNVLDGLKTESWRKSALAHDYHSVLCVPLSYDEYVYGVLSVYAEEPGFFDGLERTVFRELGENIANSINAVNTQQALRSDASLELTLSLEDSDAFLARIARELGCRVEYEGMGSHSPDETSLFFTTSGADPGDVASLLDDLVSVRSSRLISASDEGALFEATVSGGAIAPQLVRHGASPRSMSADGARMEIVAHAPTTTDVRQFVEMLRDQFTSVELVGRRNVRRETHTRRELVTSLLEDLTDRQLEVLRTAYFAGFFEWPRESTGEEVAAMLGVSQPTINRHLRIGQQRILSQLFERERAIEAA